MQQRSKLLVTSEHRVPQKMVTGRSTTEFNACEICASSYIPTYNMQHIIHIDTDNYIIAKEGRDPEVCGSGEGT